MNIVHISDDALPRACGADAVAAAFEKTGATVERTSSWGMQWLQPLVEVEGKGFGGATASAGRGKTRPTNLEDYEATGGWAGLRRARRIGPEAIVEEVLQSGLRGRGGA